jgi:uncharacterized membrane protein
MLLAEATPPPDAVQAATATVTEPVGVLAILLIVLAGIFWMAQHAQLGRIFRVIPALVFCYFVPTLLTTLGVLPEESVVYDWVKSFVLPASLLLLILALDLPGIIRLGPKALIMFLTGTAGVVIGGPMAMLVMKAWLPDDAWQGMAALSGSWIGGGANFIAIGQIAGASDEMIRLMVIPDVFVANIWMGVLLWASGRHEAIDRLLKADASAIRDLERRLTDFQAQTTRTATLADWLILLALAFGASWLGHTASGGISGFIGGIDSIKVLNDFLPAVAWKFILVTTFGVVLSFTRARRLEGVGASKLGSVMLYLLIACIGAGASFHNLGQVKFLILAAVIWIIIHIALMVAVGVLIRAPVFLIAVGSQANIGGAASAPIVAAAFHPSLAPVGVLLAILGYVLGTYMGWVCMQLLKVAAGVPDTSMPL